MVYDADGGIRGELAYLLGTLRGRHCALCDITHSGVRRKGSFDDYLCTLPVPVDVVHRNEQTPEVAAFTEGMGAVVVGETAEGLVVVLDDSALAACGGDVDKFAGALDAALTSAEAGT